MCHQEQIEGEEVSCSVRTSSQWKVMAVSVDGDRIRIIEVVIVLLLQAGEMTKH